MAYSTPCKFYNVPNAICQGCKTKLHKDKKMWVCTKPIMEHDDYHICSKCGRKDTYVEEDMKMFYMQAYNNSSTCYLHLLKRDVMKNAVKDSFYDINLGCRGCKNSNRKLECYLKKDLYGDSIVKCSLCPYRIPDDHKLYHCFDRSHLNGYDVCVDCAFRLAKKTLPEENKHHPKATPRLPYDLSRKVSNENQDFELPVQSDEYQKVIDIMKKEKEEEERKRKINLSLPNLNQVPTTTLPSVPKLPPIKINLPTTTPVVEPMINIPKIPSPKPQPPPLVPIPPPSKPKPTRGKPDKAELDDDDESDEPVVPNVTDNLHMYHDI